MSELITDPLLGKIIKDYLFLELLGKGGFGAVYLARHLHPTLKNQYVAAKFIEVRDQRGAQDVEREIRIMQEMQHPYVVRIRDTFVFDNVAINDEGHHPRFIMMDFVRGGSLDGLLRKLQRNNQLMSYAVVMAAFNQITAALTYVHRRKILHLDLKPANILLQPVSDDMPPNFLLTDFGIAQFTRPDEQLSRWGGTPLYMSPEHFGLVMDKDRGIAAPDHRSDIYALGLILYQLVVGELPFQGRVHELAQKHRYEPVPPPSGRVADIPRDLEMVILRALEKLPQDRFQSVDEFRQALDAVSLRGINPSAARVSDRQIGQLVEQHSFDLDQIITSDREASYAEAPVTAVEPVEVSERAPAQLEAFTLLVVDGDDNEQERTFQKTPVKIGRSRQCDLVLQSAWISSNHVQITAGADGDLLVTDLGSKNGTFLDGNRLTPNQPASYHPEQWLNLGDYSVQLTDVTTSRNMRPAQPAPAAENTLTEVFNSYNVSDAAPADLDLDRVVSRLQAQIRTPRINLRVTPEIVPAQVGRTEFIAVHVMPEYVEVPARYSLQVLPGPGVDASWYAIAQPKVIRPGENAVFDMTLTVPDSVRQGDYQLTLGVVTDNPDVPDVAQVVQIQVRRHVDFQISLHPNQVHHRALTGATTQLTIHNTGNQHETFSISFEAPESLRVSPATTQAGVENGQRQVIPIRLHGVDRQVAYLPYKINVSVPGTPVKQVHGTYIILNRPPLIVRLLRTLIFATFISVIIAVVDQFLLDGQIMRLLRDLLLLVFPGLSL